MWLGRILGRLISPNGDARSSNITSRVKETFFYWWDDHMDEMNFIMRSHDHGVSTIWRLD
jgi:hypothetical protein